MIRTFAVPLALALAISSAAVAKPESQDPAKAPPFEYSLMGRRHLTSAFEAAGYGISE